MGGGGAGADAELPLEFELEPLVPLDDVPDLLHPQSATRTPTAIQRAIAEFRIFSPLLAREFEPRAGNDDQLYVSANRG